VSSIADPALDERPVPDLLASVWRYRLTVLTLAMCAALAGAAIRVALPGQPTARVSVTLQTAGSDLTETAALTPAAQATFVANQTAFFHDSRLLARLSDDLHGVYSPAALARKIHASAHTTSTIVTVDVSDSKPAAAVRIANVLVTAYREAVHYRTQVAVAAATEDIAAAQADLAAKLTDAYRAGRTGRPAAAAYSTALAALAVRRTEVQVNGTTYDDGLVSWEDATAAPGGRRVPDVRLTLAGLAIGLLAGVLVAWIRADRNRQIRTGAEASRALGSALLAELPEIAGGLPDPFGDEVHTEGEPDPYFGLTSALVSNGANKVVAITGASGGSGATTTSIGLAMSAARDGERVLLVDADSRARGLATAAHIDSHRPGLYEMAAGKLGASGAIVNCAVGEGCHVDVLPPGAESHDLPHVLRSPAGRSLLSALAAHYDRVIVDTGPLLATASTVALAPLVDAVVTVIRHGTDADLAFALREHLALLQAREVGTVFTFSRTVMPGAEQS
jgi:Mrp family chromosome partitioning ATPase/capsular polysaccharide biosynthesis protein